MSMSLVEAVESLVEAVVDVWDVFCPSFLCVWEIHVRVEYIKVVTSTIWQIHIYTVCVVNPPGLLEEAEERFDPALLDKM